MYYIKETVKYKLKCKLTTFMRCVSLFFQLRITNEITYKKYRFRRVINFLNDKTVMRTEK